MKYTCGTHCETHTMNLGGKAGSLLSKHVVAVITPDWSRKSSICDGCQASCQSACKTSCTVSNQPCPEK